MSDKAPSAAVVRVLTLRSIDGPTKQGPQYGHWVDDVGQKFFCLLGLGSRLPKCRPGETWEVSCSDRDSAHGDEACFFLVCFVGLVKDDPMRKPQSTEPIFLPATVQTPNNTMEQAARP